MKRFTFLASALVATAVMTSAEAPVMVGGLFPYDEYFETSIDLVFKVKRWGLDEESYLVMVGPSPADGTAARLKFTTDAVSQSVELYLDKGYAYLSGTRPYGGTDVDDAVGEGTIWLLEADVDRDNSGAVTRYDNRYYLLEGDMLKIHRDNSDYDLGTAMYYVEHHRAGPNDTPVFNAAMPIKNSGRGPFVDAVIERARLANLPTP